MYKSSYVIFLPQMVKHSKTTFLQRNQKEIRHLNIQVFWDMTRCPVVNSYHYLGGRSLGLIQSICLQYSPKSFLPECRRLSSKIGRKSVIKPTSRTYLSEHSNMEHTQTQRITRFIHVLGTFLFSPIKLHEWKICSILTPSKLIFINLDIKIQFLDIQEPSQYSSQTPPAS